MQNKTRNTDSIRAYSKKKTEDTIEKANQAIDSLLSLNSKVNFNSVSVKSGITKSFLYNNKEISERIENIRLEQRNGRVYVNYNCEDRLNELEEIVKKLVKEIDIIKKQIAMKNGKK